jgi:hypothetical protein
MGEGFLAAHVMAHASLAGPKALGCVRCLPFAAATYSRANLRPGSRGAVRAAPSIVGSRVFIIRLEPVGPCAVRCVSVDPIAVCRPLCAA